MGENEVKGEAEKRDSLRVDMYGRGRGGGGGKEA